MGENVPPERIPRIYFLLRALEVAPKKMRIAKGDRVTFRSIVKWIRRNEPELYENLLRAYDCDDETCLARGMSQVFLRLLEAHISFQEPVERVGDVDVAIREWLQRSYPLLRL